MKILAIDTSTDACSVAAWHDGRVIERFELGRQHSQRLLTLVAEVLTDSAWSLTQLDALAFGRGPGSFTGLRIGAGVVQGLAFGADLPVVPVSTLAALAQGQGEPRLAAALDARMGQIYWGLYNNVAGIMTLEGSEHVTAPADMVLPPGAAWTGVGSGWDVYADVILARVGADISHWHAQVWPRARHVAELGAAGYAQGCVVPAEQALPVYVRDEVTHKMTPRI